MAKTIEELKQMIDSVIVENGKGQITGQGLNLVLNEMSDALSEMGGGGAKYTLRGDGTTFTEEDKAYNIEQFALIKNDFANGEVPMVSLKMSMSGISLNILTTGGGEYPGLGFILLTMGMILLNDDGTYAVQM